MYFKVFIRKSGAKDPLLSRRRFIQSFPSITYQGRYFVSFDKQE